MLRTVLISAWVLLFGAWGVINLVTSYTTLPEDLDEFWRENLMGTPLLPWVSFIVGIFALAALLFPEILSSIVGKRAVPPLQDRSVHGATLNNSILHTGDIKTTVFTRGRVVLSDDSVKSLSEFLKGHEKRIAQFFGPKGGPEQEIAEKLLADLRGYGIVFSEHHTLYMPQPNRTYHVHIKENGTAVLTIAPGVIP